MPIRSLVLLVLVSLPLIAQESPDSVHLAGGTVLKGRIVLVSELGLDLELAPKTPPLRVLWSHLSGPGVTTVRQVGFQLANGDRVSGSVESFAAGVIALRTGDLGMVKVPLASLPAPKKGDAPGVGNVITANAEPAPPIETKPKEWTAFKTQPWKGTARLSGTLQTGNIETFLIDLLVKVNKTWSRDQLNALARFRYGETDGEQSAAFGLIGAKFDHYIDPDYYIYFNQEISRDEVQNLDFRALLGVGLGYMAWRGEKDDQFLALEAGVSALYEAYKGQDGELDPAGRVALNYQNLLFDELRFSQSFELLVPFTDVNDYIFRSGTGLAYPLSERMSADARLDLSYYGDPPAGTKELDIVLTAGIEYSF